MSGTPENYRLDGEARALYYAAYRSKYNEVQARVVPAKEIPEDLDVSVVGNNGLKPESFDLRNSDRQPIDGLVYPGKSAHISFTGEIDTACHAIFDRPVRRGDHLYTVPTVLLKESDFHPFYAPLPNLPLHARIVHDAQRQDPTIRDVPHKARVKLVEIFKRYQIA